MTDLTTDQLDNYVRDLRYKPILVLDFDGVCHSYTSGWQGADNIPDPPVEGLFEFLEQASKVFDIQVFSSRSHQPDAIGAMKTWFDYYWCNYKKVDFETTEIDNSHILSWLKFPIEKPPAFLTIDDRAICFEGTWPKIEDLKNFKPWNKR